MKKKLLIVLGVFVALIAVFVGVVMAQPGEYTVQRSASISAPAADVHAQVNDFHKWDAWSPWAKLDPNMKTTFEGPTAGVGSKYHWVGNDDVGEGQMTITESKPGELVKIDLKFVKPFESNCDTVFTFKADGDKTQVTWTMTGKNNFIGKAFCLFMDMDKMIGGDFEKGLKQMKDVVEKKEK